MTRVPGLRRSILPLLRHSGDPRAILCSVTTISRTACHTSKQNNKRCMLDTPYEAGVTGLDGSLSEALDCREHRTNRSEGSRAFEQTRFRKQSNQHLRDELHSSASSRARGQSSHQTSVHRIPEERCTAESIF